MESTVRDIYVRLQATERAGYRLAAGDFNLVWGLRRWPAMVRAASAGALGALGEDMARMMERLRAEKEEYDKDVVRFQTEVPLPTCHSSTSCFSSGGVRFTDCTMVLKWPAPQLTHKSSFAFTRVSG